MNKIIGAILALLAFLTGVMAYFGWVFGVAYGVIGVLGMTTFSFLGVFWLIVSSFAIAIGVTIGFLLLTAILIKVADKLIK